MAKNSEYWEKRVASEVWRIYNSIEEKNRELLDFYIGASESVKDELYRLAEKLSKDGALSLSEMHKQNRLAELNKKFEKIIENLGHDIEEFAKKNMQQGFQRAYKAVAVSMGDTDFAMPNKKLMEKLMETPWRGDTFSGRLWKNQKKLANVLNDVLLVGLQQGKTATEIAIQLHNRMGQSFNDCHRLVRTETMHYLNDATLQRYKDAGVEMVRIWAALDERTCDTCGGYHAKKYPINKCPHVPLHANCRCTVLPVVDEKTVKTQKFKMGGQEYRKVDRGSKAEFTLKKDVTIVAQKVDTYDTDVFVSVNVNIKPKALHIINKNTEEAMRKWGISSDRKPQIVIVDYSEMPTAYGKYDAVHNIVYYLPQITNENAVDTVGYTEYHEMWHMKQAEIYRRVLGKITEKNYNSYIAYTCKKAKKFIDSKGIEEYNVNELSAYAAKMFFIERYDEVEAEYKALVEGVGKQW